ncbi:MAG: SurA N-terminal domain-containing protein [Candidatus Rokubacteria bacterium]|nr:SurA N-terminal domain-containing protein [Candidatus Rokubacteria bacterium]
MITMMRRYRRTLQVGLLVVVAAFIASLFLFGSSGLNGGGGRDSVATVNGESIPFERYQRRYQAYVEAYAQIYRDRFSQELAERLGLPQQVVSDLVQEAVIVQRARAEGLDVSDEELNAQIQAFPAFQENGRFTLRRYQEFLKRRGLTPVAFETDIRRELTRLKVEGAVRGGVKVSPVEVEHAFVLRREEIRAQWALVELTPLIAAAQATDQELVAYLGKHADEFRQPERRRVQYVTLAQKDFLKPVAEADVEKYYAANPKEFESPRQARAFHILARVPETGGSEAEDKAKAKIADAIRRARAGEDFAKLAKELSEDPGSAPKGGDLGLVSQGEMVPQFEQALFKLKKDEISPEPVRTPFGFHAIRVLEVREGGRKPLKEVAGPIRDRLAAEAADRAMKARADEIRPPLQAAKDFMAEAKTLGLTAAESTIARVDRLAGLGAPDPLEEAAFALTLGGVSTPVKTPAGLMVLKAIETIAAGVPPLGEIRDKVTVAVKHQKAEGAALERATQLVADARSGDFSAATKKAGAAAGETPRFSRQKPAEKLPGDAMLAALQTAAGGLTAPVKTPQGYYVLKVLERVAPDMSALSGERDKILKDVLAQKQSQAWESWVSGARAGAKVEVHRVPSRRG